MKTALIGAEKEVYEFAAKLIHAEASISQIAMPCCEVLSYVVPTKDADKIVASAPAKKVTKAPLWVPLSTLGKLKDSVGIGNNVAKGAHVQYLKTPKAKVLSEGVVVHSGPNGAAILADSGFMAAIPYKQIKSVDAHNPGTPDSGYAIKWLKKPKIK